VTEPIRTSVILLASLGLLASACRPSVDYCADYDPHAYLPDEWQVIPPGTFEMGSTDGDEREQPTHFVTVEGFLMWRTEVTVEQYAQCFCAGACEEPYIDATPVVQNWDVPDREQHPVNYATWHHAAAYCEFVEGRLPSEAEWEHAARSGGQPIAYAWGDEWASCGHAVMDEGGPGCGEGHTGEVCSRPDGNSDQLLCDMHGNLWEWVADEYHGNYSGAPTDGSAWNSADGNTGIVRGGSFADDDGHVLRAAYRASADPDVGTYTAGFRCAR